MNSGGNIFIVISKIYICGIPHRRKLTWRVDFIMACLCWNALACWSFYICWAQRTCPFSSTVSSDERVAKYETWRETFKVVILFENPAAAPYGEDVVQAGTGATPVAVQLVASSTGPLTWYRGAGAISCNCPERSLGNRFHGLRMR